MIEREGFPKTCPRCNGTGKEKESGGIFTVVEKEIDCKMCKGSKAIFYVTTCPLMSLGAQWSQGQSSFNPTFQQCIGINCTLWDRESGDGGCLMKKAFSNQARRLI
jgi:hypothetical protein